MPARLLILLLLLLGAAPPAAAQKKTKQPQKQKTLKQLKKERDAALLAYLDAKTRLDLLLQERRKLLAKQAAANKRLLAAEKLTPIPARQQAVRSAKQELHRIGQELAANQLKLEPQQTAVELLRLQAINRITPYATRLLVVARRTTPTRPAHAEKLTRQAMEDLKRRADFLKYVQPPAKPPKSPQFDPRFTPSERLRWLLARLKEQIGRFRQQLKELEPFEERQEALVKRLTRLIDIRGGRADLDTALKRERQHLETIKGLRRQIQGYQGTYLKQAQRVSDTLKLRREKH